MRENISVEMTQPFTEVWNAVARIPEIQNTTCEKLMRSQSDWMELWMEYGARQMQALNGNRDPRESAAMQSQLMSEYSTRLFECAVDLFDIVTKANMDLLSCLGMPGAREEPAALSDRSKSTSSSAKARRTAEASAA